MPTSAWEAVARTQKQTASAYHLIRQPDHARLAGEFVQQINFASGSALDDGIVEGISLHDEGWAAFDDQPDTYQVTPLQVSSACAVNSQGKPISFLDVRAPDAIRAWYGSIELAENTSTIAGLLVSHHFVRIARFGISAGHYNEQDCHPVQAFLSSEEARQHRLQPLQKRSQEEVQYWTDVLQFCDLLSLYLCCGSEEWIEFPHEIFGPGKRITAKPQIGGCVLSPALLKSPCSFSLAAWQYPPKVDYERPTLSWCVR